MLSAAAPGCRQLQRPNLLSLSSTTGIGTASIVMIALGWCNDYIIISCVQTILQRTLFPIGHLLKSEVRQIAREAGLSWVAEKEEVSCIMIIAN